MQAPIQPQPAKPQGSDKISQIKSFLEGIKNIAGTITDAYAPLVKNTGNVIKNTAQGLGRGVLEAGSYPLDVASNMKGEDPMPPVDVPGLGQVKTLGRTAVDIDNAGGNTDLSRAAGLTRSIGDFAGGLATAGGAYDATKAGVSALSSPKTFEQSLEQAEGWNPGDKIKFDTALHNGDAKTVTEMLPQVPQDYVKTFFNRIKEVTDLPPMTKTMGMPIEDQLGKMIEKLPAVVGSGQGASLFSSLFGQKANAQGATLTKPWNTLTRDDIMNRIKSAKQYPLTPSEKISIQKAIEVGQGVANSQGGWSSAPNSSSLLYGAPWYSLDKNDNPILTEPIHDAYVKLAQQATQTGNQKLSKYYSDLADLYPPNDTQPAVSHELLKILQYVHN